MTTLGLGLGLGLGLWSWLGLGLGLEMATIVPLTKASAFLCNERRSIRSEVRVTGYGLRVTSEELRVKMQGSM